MREKDSVCERETVCVRESVNKFLNGKFNVFHIRSIELEIGWNQLLQYFFGNSEAADLELIANFVDKWLLQTRGHIHTRDPYMLYRRGAPTDKRPIQERAPILYKPHSMSVLKHEHLHCLKIIKLFYHNNHIVVYNIMGHTPVWTALKTNKIVPLLYHCKGNEMPNSKKLKKSRKHIFVKFKSSQE